ncbi:alpha/beta fold hydrolase [Leifsonia poae]|uniref:alpha/beta fold hydrolase n=1 Tax=Leifsonia poae TaxID=110933 RepID=UPI001CC17901|nr:alpha/beta fold hydrolase [Leifsonia poae]
MELFTREWGTGDRRAVLVHGAMSDSRNWRRVGPALAELGYHVTAVDLRGHGRSPRAHSYTAELLAQDVVDTVPAHPELIVGHSLGGLAVSLAVEELRPARAVYVDPAFGPSVPWWQAKLAPAFFRSLSRATAVRIAKRNPRWDPVDVAIELETLRAFDHGVVPVLVAPGSLRAPATMQVPSLVVLAGRSQLVRPRLAERLRGAGFAVRVVAGAGHTVHRDDHQGFMHALDGWA